MRGLNTATRWRAMRARRRRRCSSSVFPENMQPVITSSNPQPWAPCIMAPLPVGRGDVAASRLGRAVGERAPGGEGGRDPRRDVLVLLGVDQAVGLLEA